MKEIPCNSHSFERRVALFGGSFDPVHRAHIEVARMAHQGAAMSEVVFIPAARSPLKKHEAIASDADRVEMLRLALKADKQFSIDTREIERGSTSYTVETVSEIKAAHPEWKLFWILGADQVELLPNWRRIRELSNMVQFLVVARPGYSLAAPQLNHFQYTAIEAPLMEHSSSEIRARLRSGMCCADWLPPAVDAFISSKGLYTL